MRLYLIENNPYGVRASMVLGLGQIVALTPEACYHLDKIGVKYSIIEDYCSKPSTEEYLGLFNEWIDMLDAALGTDLKIAMFYAFYWRYRVLDQLFMKCHMVNKLFDALNPSEIVLVTQSKQELVFDYTMGARHPSYYSQIIPMICKKRGISIEIICSESSGQKQAVSSNWRSNKILQHLVFNFKRFITIGSPEADKKLNIFVPKTVHIGTDFIVEASNRGHVIYGTSQDTQKVTVVFSGNDITSWFNDLFRCDVSEIVSQRLNFFVSEICPLVLGYYDDLLAHFQICGIDMVLMPHDTTPRESAALLAAQQLGIKRVCVSHGDGIDYRSWDERELRSYDVIVTGTSERQRYYQDLAKELGLNTQIYVSPHRLASVHGVNRRHKGKIVYLPTFFNGDSCGLQYQDGWYYKLQTAILTIFSTYKDYEFIWKEGIGADRLYNPIPDFIEDKGFSNIKVATDSFAKHLKYADRVICDLPSTGFYEAVVSGVPVMTLWRRDMPFRQSALDYFGNLIKPFSNIEEAVAQIENFLCDFPERYQMKLDIGDELLVDILERL